MEVNLLFRFLSYVTSSLAANIAMQLMWNVDLSFPVTVVYADYLKDLKRKKKKVHKSLALTFSVSFLKMSLLTLVIMYVKAF